MKTKLTLLLLLLPICVIFSQQCDETETASLNGEIYDFHLENCTTTVAISTLNKNTVIHGITLIDAMTSINIRATGNNRISIKPDDPLDFIDILATNTFASVEKNLESKQQSSLRLRSNEANTERSEKDLDGYLIYPNPVDTITTIDIESPIFYYKIVTDYGLTVKEGTVPASKQLNLETLTEGWYFLLLQTESEIILTKLYKN